jgi:hypothetical protein
MHDVDAFGRLIGAGILIYLVVVALTVGVHHLFRRAGDSKTKCDWCGRSIDRHHPDCPFVEP